MKLPSTSSHSLLAMALVAGALGGGLAVTAATLLRPAPATRVATPNEVAVRRDTEAPAGLGPRLDAMERRLAALELVPPLPEAQPASRIEQPTALDASSIERSRLAEIEAVVAKLAAAEALRDVGVAEQVARREARDRERAERAVTARATILDPTASEEFKLDAWGDLRRVAPWGDAIVNEMIRIGETSESEDTRADVWRQADGSDRNTLLVRPLLSALSNDTSERVRSEAAETLQNYIGEPGVKAALLYAAEHDPSGEVREEAQSSLNGR